MSDNIANWQPIFCYFIRSNMPVWAVKLWAEVTRYQDPMKLMNVKAAHIYVQGIRTLNQPLPAGNEHPDIAEEMFAYYTRKVESQR